MVKDRNSIFLFVNLRHNIKTKRDGEAERTNSGI